MPVIRKLRYAAVAIVLVSLAAHASDSDAAIVQANGKAWLNGTVVPQISAIFPGDTLQTKTDLADIDAHGSKVRILNSTLLTYRSNAVELQEGAVSVLTSNSLGTQIGPLMVRPAAATWTEFQVTNMDGAVHIVATKGDVLVADEHGTTTLNAGQETTREIPKKKRRKGGGYYDGAATVAKAPLLNSLEAKIGAGVIIIGVTTWVLCQDEDPISPDTPQGGCF
jgi:hypothetical protein